MKLIFEKAVNADRTGYSSSDSVGELARDRMSKDLSREISEALEKRNYVVMRDGNLFYAPNRLGGQVSVEQKDKLIARGEISFDNFGGLGAIPDPRIDINGALKSVEELGYSYKLVKTSDELKAAEKALERLKRTAILAG